MSLMIQRESPRLVADVNREREIRAKLLKDSIQYLTYISDCKSKYPHRLMADHGPVEYEKEELERRAYLVATDTLCIVHAISWLDCKISEKPFTATIAKTTCIRELSGWVRTMEKVIHLAIEHCLSCTIERHQSYICGFKVGIQELEERIKELSLKPGNDLVIQKKRGQIEDMQNRIPAHERDLKIVLEIGKDPRSLIE